jgi:branched-chain amino acid transport system permease protein
VDYEIGVAVTACLYVILAVGYNFQIGQAGLFSVAHAAFYGIGAYATAIVAADHGLSFVPALAIGALASAALSLLLGLLTLRVRGDYLVVSSFAFQLIVIAVIVNWPSFTHGPIGILGIRRPEILAADRDYLILCLVLAAACVAVCVSISRSPFGRALRAARDDALAAAAVGKRVNHARLAIFVFSSGLAGLAGGLYAYYQGFVSPISFSIEVSVVVLAMVILGGLGRIRGAIVGVIILVLLPELISELDLSSAVVGPLQQIIYGSMLVAMMVIRPEGIVGTRRRRRRRAVPATEGAP